MDIGGGVNSRRLDLRKGWAGHEEQGPSWENRDRAVRDNDESGVRREPEVERLGAFGEAVTGQVWLDQASQDDQAVYARKESATGGGGTTVRWDIATRQETAVATPSDTPESDWPSADEHWLVRGIQSLEVRPMSGGEWRTLASGGYVWPHAITPDGNWVIYGNAELSGTRDFFRVPLAGGKPERLGGWPSSAALNGLWVSSDGRQILTVSTNYGKYDLWVLDNFVPSVKH